MRKDNKYSGIFVIFLLLSRVSYKKETFLLNRDVYVRNTKRYTFEP